jgi:phosphate transport system substrate-binding protein
MRYRIACLLLLFFSFCIPSIAQVALNGAGSTFVFPIFSKWADEYEKQHPDVRISYLPNGSGAGIALTMSGMLDFGGTDAPVDDVELSKSKVQLLHVPVILGADVAAYNLPEVQTTLQFTGELLAKIFLGKVTTWNDPAIAAVNPTVNLPNRAITVVHRQDGSGTTYIWTDYLSKISPEWKIRVGKGTKLKWPVGIEANGNEGVSQKVQELSGAIGYVELSYAEKKKIPFGNVQNNAGRFIRASVSGIEEAAASSDLSHADFRVSISNAPGPTAYPIASFSWILIPTHARSPEVSKALRDFLSWVVIDGQKYAPALSFCPLPQQVVEKAQRVLNESH